MTPSEEIGDPYSSMAEDETMDVVLLLPVQESKQRYATALRWSKQASINLADSFEATTISGSSISSLQLLSLLARTTTTLPIWAGSICRPRYPRRPLDYKYHSGRRAGYCASGLLRKGARQ